MKVSSSVIFNIAMGALGLIGATEISEEQVNAFLGGLASVWTFGSLILNHFKSKKTNAAIEVAAKTGDVDLAKKTQ